MSTFLHSDTIIYFKLKKLKNFLYIDDGSEKLRV